MSSRAASSSVWRLPGPSPRGRTQSCSTSRSRTSTPRCATGCGARYAKSAGERCGLDLRDSRPGGGPQHRRPRRRDAGGDRAGRPPEEVFSRPASRWVAEFLGDADVLPTVRAGTVQCELGMLPVDPVRWTGRGHRAAESISLTTGPGPGASRRRRPAWCVESSTGIASCSTSSWSRGCACAAAGRAFPPGTPTITSVLDLRTRDRLSATGRATEDAGPCPGSVANPGQVEPVGTGGSPAASRGAPEARRTPPAASSPPPPRASCHQHPNHVAHERVASIQNRTGPGRSGQAHGPAPLPLGSEDLALEPHVLGLGRGERGEVVRAGQRLAAALQLGGRTWCGQKRDNPHSTGWAQGPRARGSNRCGAGVAAGVESSAWSS